jgi:hypothetical protein
MSHEADCKIVAALHIPAHLDQAPSGAATATSLKMFINLASDTAWLSYFTACSSRAVE